MSKVERRFNEVFFGSGEMDKEERSIVGGLMVLLGIAIMSLIYGSTQINDGGSAFESWVLPIAFLALGVVCIAAVAGSIRKLIVHLTSGARDEVGN